MTKVKTGIILVLLFLGSCTVNHDLKWRQGQGYRWAKIIPGNKKGNGFKMMSASQTNISFKNHLTKQHIAQNRNLLNGSGIATGDIDGDGLTDVYFAQLDGPNKLYKNLGGFRFKDITERAGVAHKGYHSTGVVFADVDGDRDLDLLITTLEKRNSLYINNGKGKFKLKKDSGLGASHGSTTMALADIDNDGDLDLYITNYKKKSVKDLYDPMEITWARTVKKGTNGYRLIPPFDTYFKLIPNHKIPERRELGTKDELYINMGDNHFKKVANPDYVFLDQNGNNEGLSKDWGLTAKFYDLNDDQLPDLYVCNDYWTRDRVWINQGNGTFKAIDQRAIRNFSFASMAVAFSDINRDGSVDFFVTEMLSPEHQNRMRQAVNYSPFSDSIGQIKNQPQYMRNTLYLNRGDNTFAEIASLSGVEATGWSWATRFLDVDLDGYEDLIINTGNAYNVLDIDSQQKLSQAMIRNQRGFKGYILKYPSLKLPNKAFKNNGNLTFSDKSSDWGFMEKDVSQGLATADFDNDGDLDLAINRLNESAAIFKNTASAPRIAVRLRGTKPNTQAIGAKIKLTGGPVNQQKEVVSGGDYVSGSDPLIVFAAAKEHNYTLTVDWPNGTKTLIGHVKANKIYEIQQPVSVRKKNEVQHSERDGNLFEDVSDRIDHKHHEKAYNDFVIQPLLPMKLSQLGPGVSWIDFDNDGDDDLFVGSGKGGRLGLFENEGNGHFKKRTLSALTEKAPGDQTTIIGWNDKEETHIIVGNSNYEDSLKKKTSAFNYLIHNDHVIKKSDLTASFSTTGPLAMADYDGDGDVDLFVGGRFIPGYYPINASSKLFRNNNGSFELDKRNSKILNQIGLVTGAVFTDYDQDGDQDLLLSREWDSLLLLENDNGTFRDATKSVGLHKYKGWWNGIATGDFNNDGRPDIIATNRGLNSSYKRPSDAEPLKMYYDNFNRNQNQRPEIVEAYYDPKMSSYVPKRRLHALYRSIPSVLSSVNSYKQFSYSSLKTILGLDLSSIPSKEINTLEQMVFINNGKDFTAYPLPQNAQLTVSFSANVADFNNDGNEDIFLSQNLFALPKLIPRQDAGRGLWLQGDGKGEFKTLDGRKTGIKVYGEQRGAALSDFNKDGKIDLAVSQNGAETKLYLNRSKKVGLSVKLIGPDKNREAIGSSIRIIYKNGSKGPRREVQVGSGYWSQNSTTQIMGTTSIPESLEITWFGGIVQIVNILPGKKNYRIRYSPVENGL